MKKIILLFFLFPLLISAQKKAVDTLLINCDTIYSKKGLSILHITYDKEVQDGYFGEKNSVFIFRKKLNGVVKEIYRDTIFSTVQQIDFKDFNNDKVKDILVQNISNVRSNWTYNLYLVNPKDYTLKKVKGFEDIKNPVYNSKYNIVESMVVSGQDYMSFYKILPNKIYDYNIIVTDDHQENGNFGPDYDKAIQKILRKNKTLLKKK